MKRKGFITVKKSFLIILSGLSLMGYLSEFALLFCLVCLHEAAHVAAAKLCGAKTHGITVMPLGLSAEIKGFDCLPMAKKVIILLSGPLFNLLLSGAAFVLFGKAAAFFIGANLCIFAINMLPVMPLDGGNTFMAIFNNRLGILPAADILSALGRFFAAGIMLIGVIQVILFPYNISLICLGFYLFNFSKDKSIAFQNIFIKILKLPESKKSAGIIPVKQLALMADRPVFDALKPFGFNCYLVINIVEDGNIRETVTEGQIIDYVMEKGLCGTVWDVGK